MIRFFCLFFMTLFSGQAFAQDFLAKQLLHERVNKAWQKQEGELSTLLKDKGLNLKNFRLFIRAFKVERELEVWVSPIERSEWTLLKTIPVCAASGSLGPKIQEGDQQVPEGIYVIDRYNPLSAFHLSLGINYPNMADRLRSKGKSPGGDIFIHGKCASIGCLAITDKFIEPLYLLAALAKRNGQGQIQVQIFPFHLKASSLEKMSKLPDNIQWAGFWKNLEEVYNHFETNRTPGIWRIKPDGKYFLVK